MYGGWRQPPNIWKESGIHNDEVAQRVGMRGGTIPGTIHLNLFPPLLIELFGRRWLEKGSISMYYTYATLDREEVRAVVALPPEGREDVQVEAWVEMPDGRVVAKGTVSVGEPTETSYVRSIELKNAAPGELRILASVCAGQETPARDDVVFTQEELDRVLETITDPIDWYRGSSPWGPSVLNPASMYTVLNAGLPASTAAPAVGFFGATDIRLVNGPIMVGVPYRTTGKVVCAGASPKTEFAWVDSQLHEKASGKLVAEMRHMTRLMKAGSPAYQEA
jgi:hypothetical protein